MQEEENRLKFLVTMKPTLKLEKRELTNNFWSARRMKKFRYVCIRGNNLYILNSTLWWILRICSTINKTPVENCWWHCVNLSWVLKLSYTIWSLSQLQATVSLSSNPTDGIAITTNQFLVETSLTTITEQVSLLSFATLNHL